MPLSLRLKLRQYSVIRMKFHFFSLGLLVKNASYPHSSTSQTRFKFPLRFPDNMCHLYDELDLKDVVIMYNPVVKTTELKGGFFKFQLLRR